MFFQSRNPLTGPQFKDSNIVKSFDLITALENCIFFISKYLKRLLQSTFYSWFKFPFESHSYDTRRANLGNLKLNSSQTKTNGGYSTTVNAICLESLANVTFQLCTKKLKEVLITFSLNSYN